MSDDNMAYRLGQALERNERLCERLAELEKGTPKQGASLSSSLWTIVILIGCVVVGLLIYERLPVPGAAPLPTAIVGRTTSLPAPTSDYGVGAYNEAQRERAEEANQEQGQEGQGQQVTPVPQEPAAAPVPTADEAQINAWLEGPVSTQTPLPDVGEPGFVESFQDSGCSAMIGYLPGHPCYVEKGED